MTSFNGSLYLHSFLFRIPFGLQFLEHLVVKKCKLAKMNLFGTSMRIRMQQISGIHYATQHMKIYFMKLYIFAVFHPRDCVMKYGKHFHTKIYLTNFEIHSTTITKHAKRIN